MDRETLLIIKRASWVVTCALSFLWAYKGYDSTPRFSMWFWGIAFTVDVLALGAVLRHWFGD